MDNDDADRLASIAYIEHHRKTPDSLFLLRIINEKDAQLARAEKVIAAAHKYINNEKYYDEFVSATIKYDRPSAPERDGRAADG